MKDGKGKRMVKRKKLTKNKEPDNYFISNEKKLEFVSSGCQVLDCALGGGYPLGKMTNIVGDKSTAKTGLACEAITNFLKKYPDGIAAYRDVEAAFEHDYARAMGLPVDYVDFGEGDESLNTIEEFSRDIESFLNKQIERDTPGIYVLDSLDALSDEEEMTRDLEKGSYGMTKQKKLGTIFRKIARKLKKSRVLLIIISQVRENIGVAFGEKYRRSGGKAMDHYASQALWLSQIKTLKKTVKKVERPYGIKIKGKLKKNKIGLPFRECDFDFVFGYGVDDLAANIEWLKNVNRLGDLDLSDNKLKSFFNEVDKMSNKEFNKTRKRAAKTVKTVWPEIETSFLPKRSKYGEQ